MQILTTRNAGFWARHMRVLLFHTDPITTRSAGTMCQACHRLSVDPAHCQPTILLSTVWHTRSIGPLCMANRLISSSTTKSSTIQALSLSSEDVMAVAKSNQHTAMSFTSTIHNSAHSQDLKRFLQEVGTDPREGRYWLKQFQRSTGPFHPFAVVQVDEQVMRDKDMLDALTSSLAFLHRNGMKLVLLHGHSLDSTGSSSEELQEQRQQILIDNMMLVSKLESHGAPARPLFAGSRIIQAQPHASCPYGTVSDIYLDAVKWAMQSNHIPVVQAIGETPDGQLISVDAADATAEVSKALQPLKVLFVNTEGGISDEMGEVIPNINLPADLDHADSKPWCTPDIEQEIRFIAQLLNSLPSQSSVVVTAASKLIAELFTHHGSGTLFKNTEPIHLYTQLANVDHERVQALINRSFGQDLEPNYFDTLPGRFNTLYLSEGYNAAAVITNEKSIDIPYLDKFAVSMVKQGEGTGEMLWDCIRRDFKQLFWRSRASNRINAWYFKRSEGSWSNGKWIVFWYGIPDHQVSSQLIDYALKLPSSFGNNGNGQDNTLVE